VERHRSKDTKQPAPMDVEMEEVVKEQPKKEEPKKEESKKDEPSQPVVVEKKRMVIKNLGRKVSKEHLMEIFGVYGTIIQASVLPFDMRASFNSTKGYVDYEREEDAEKAVKHYSGGQIDGKVVICEVVDINQQQQPEQPAGEGRGRFTSITTEATTGKDVGLQARSPPRRHRQISPPRRSPPGRIGRGATGGNRVPLGDRYHGGR